MSVYILLVVLPKLPPTPPTRLIRDGVVAQQRLDGDHDAAQVADAGPSGPLPRTQNAQTDLALHV